MKYISLILFLLVGCSASPEPDKIARFNKRFDSVKVGMELAEALNILGLGRHEIHEVEHPDGRLIHTKLYLYKIETPDRSATWKLKTDGSSIVIEKNKDIEPGHGPYGENAG